MKGVVFSIYLAPTYINIFTIYSISNIHDVTWGSRPSAQIQKSNEVENQMKIKYKNYRAKFLVVWMMVNIVVGYSQVYMSRNEQYTNMFVIAIILMTILLMKITFACLYWFKAKNDRKKAKRMLSEKFSDVFANDERNDSEGNIIE